MNIVSMVYIFNILLANITLKNTSIVFKHIAIHKYNQLLHLIITILNRILSNYNVTYSVYKYKYIDRPHTYQYVYSIIILLWSNFTINYNYYSYITQPLYIITLHHHTIYTLNITSLNHHPINLT